MTVVFHTRPYYYKGLERASALQWWIGRTLDLAVSPNKQRNVFGAGIGPSLGTTTMPYSRLRDYPCENQTQNPSKDAIFVMLLAQYNGVGIIIALSASLADRPYFGISVGSKGPPNVRGAGTSFFYPIYYLRSSSSSPYESQLRSRVTQRALPYF